MGTSPDAVSQWFDVLFETSPTGLGVISALENRYVRANAALVDLYGMPLEELLDTDPYSLALRITHPDDLVAEQKLFAELASGKRHSYRHEKRYVRPDGSIRWGLLTMSALFEPSTDPAAAVGPLGSVTIQVIDLTELKTVRESLARRDAELRHAQRIDAIGRLSAGIAHDFNNLLTVITGYGQALKQSLSRSSDGLREADDVDAILAAAERAAGLTAQLLSHGRRAPSTPRAFVLSDLVLALQRLLSRTLGSNIEIAHALDAKGAIFADQDQVGQVVMNLVLNARDALGERGHIRLETRDAVVHDTGGGSPGPADWVALVVSDDGHGMNPEVKARMFEPFFTTREGRPGIQGSGLGLATVQRIVAEATGHIEVESAVGLGTTVTIFFPRVELPRDKAPSKPPSRRAPIPNSQRVLVIEDDPSVRSLVATVLLGAHYRVAVARNGEEALRLIDATKEGYDLVVTDLEMPRLGGVELARALHERGRAPRMLFISGYSNHAPAELAPYGTLLSKPFTPDQLLSKTSEILAEEPAS